MGKKGKIALYRETLDKTLASDNLTDENKLRALVENQILRSSEGNTRDYIDNVLEKRTAEVSNFLEMLRSVSKEYGTPDHTHQASWKLKQDTEEFRVMYREGLSGSPFHSLLVEGYIDAPLDVCLCVSWETALYPRWFPEMLIPTFKVVAAKSLQKVMIGEEISLVRVKLSWPMSSREAVLHYFEFEYLEDGLVIGLINTIPDVDDVQMETHGFTNDGIPDVENTVRIDLVGGFALQRVTESRSYFRTIANMDIKLDFVPPTLINFISRQVIGSGFRFYQKTVASVSKGDEAFAKVLSGPLYCRIREALSSNTEGKKHETQSINNCMTITNGKQKADVQDESREDGEKVLSSSCAEIAIDCIREEESCDTNATTHKKHLGDMFKVKDETVLSKDDLNEYFQQNKPATEIEEETEGSESAVEKRKANNDDFEKYDQFQSVNVHKNVPISPQVEKALGTLDKLISVVREGRLRSHDTAQPGPWVEAGEATSSTMRQQNVGSIAHVDDLRSTDQVSDTLTSPVENPPIGNWSRNAVSAGNSPVIDSLVNPEVDSIHENNKKHGQPRKWKFCCLQIVSGRLIS
ncbi:hypothetical protein RND81_08G163000 [Saponaria officinalis]|uniref:Uncharacterized protein n=1 Tax=Saponaria officinalis TaxID=3572 RepID=A0AAW1JBE9_SAPOF